MTSGTHFVSSSSSSPNCVRSLEAQLEAASLMSTPSSSPSSAFTKKSSNDTNDDPPKMMISWSLVRDQILQLTIVTGNLSSLFLNHRTTTSNNQSDKNVHNQLSPRIVAVLRVLWELSQSLHILLSIACQNKINLNNRKYPVDLCKGKSGKYTEYSQQTGITKTTGQSIIHESALSTTTASTSIKSFLETSIGNITKQTRQFAMDREWEQYHTPRNLLLALIGELGELAELVQWHGDADDEDESPRLQRASTSVEHLHDQLAQELADVTIYLMRLADVCQLDLSKEAKLHWESKDMEVNK